jgi:hypothetical protein
MMDTQFFLGMTAGTVQALGMKHIEKETITFIFIHQIADWEIHRRASSEPGCSPLE